MTPYNADGSNAKPKKRPASTTSERGRQAAIRGAELLQQGRTGEAIPYLERACRSDALSVPALLNLGAAYVIVGRHKDAIPLLEAARDAEPDNPMIWMDLGAAYLGNPVLATPEQQQRAIAALETALDLDAEAPNAHYNLGLIRIDRNEFELARESFHRALQVNPLDRDALSWLKKIAAQRTGSQVE